MPYFADLSEYEYFRHFARPGTRNIGWLSPEHSFERTSPTQAELDRLWQFCKISVAQIRSIHECDLCPTLTTCRVLRNDEALLLGTSEIRVFGAAGEIYAAPTLIYHYVESHHYSPPVEFMMALQHGYAPPDESYFNQLAKIGLKWDDTSSSSGMRMKP